MCVCAHVFREDMRLGKDKKSDVSKVTQVFSLKLRLLKLFTLDSQVT